MELAFGIVGLLLALYQIRKAERAADAAREAVIDASENTNRFTFLLLVPELALVEHELDRAVGASDKNEALRLLRDWRARASDMRGLLGVFELPSDALAKAIAESIAQSSTAHSAISKGKVVSISAAKARAVAAQVVAQARSDAQTVRAGIVPPRGKPTAREDLRALGKAFASIVKKRNNHA